MDRYRVKLIGTKAKVRYKFSHYGFIWYNPSVEEIHEDKEDVVFWNGEIDQPKLEVGEKIYIAELDKVFTIKDIARNSNGGYMCWTDDYFEEIEDEETIKTKAIAEMKQDEYNRRQQEKAIEELCEKDKEESAKASEPRSVKKWYQFWK